MDLLILLLGGTLVLVGGILGVWSTLYVQRWTLNHSVQDRVLERTDPIVPTYEYDNSTPFEARIASGESALNEGGGSKWQKKERK